MAQPRRAKRIDANQNEIVKKLRALPGVTVDLDHNDLLIGTKDAKGLPVNLWFEVKSKNAIDKNGRLKSNALKRSQIDLLRTWQGHYEIVYTYEEILERLGEIWGK